jgi:hypothetical protein
VTPTSDFFRPMAQTIEVALGASETMRKVLDEENVTAKV